MSIGMFIVLVLCVILGIAAILYQRKETNVDKVLWESVRQAPLEQLSCRVLNKCCKSSLSVSGSFEHGVYGGTSFECSILLEDKSGKRIRLPVSYEDFDMILEGDSGILNYKTLSGEMYYMSFETSGYCLKFLADRVFNSDTFDKRSLYVWRCSNHPVRVMGSSGGVI